MRRARSKVRLALVASLVGICWPSVAAAQTPPPAISLTVSPAQITGVGAVALTGVAPGAAMGSSIDVYASPYPYTASTPVGTAFTDAQGAFSLTSRADRNTRYRAVLASTGAVAVAAVGVVAKTIIRARALKLGRAMVTVLIFHPSDLNWNGARTQWTLSAPGQSLTLTGRTSRLSRYVTLMRIIVPLPAGRFRWRVCFSVPEAGALLDPQRPARCSRLGYRGASALPVGFPGPRAIAHAQAYLAGRAGVTAFAVVDTEGRLSGVNAHSTFITASVVKAMLLVGYLRRLDAMGQHTVDSFSNSFLYPMIHVSDNNAATQCWSIVGDSGLYSVARAAGMTDFSVSGLWGSALLSAADQARFFFEMDSLIPHEFVGYARLLLSTIDPTQSWGIPVIARPLGYKVFFKDGSEPTGLGQLVHQIGRLEGHHRTFAIAVMTDGDPTMQYGIGTIQGVTHALLG
ncbi:MAG: hypothetical protein M3076_03200 [Actinomycetota bacterium]|nr:hypothetical protein [Actinomycetota bacterium]